MIVYEIINLKTGMRYIGQTEKTLEYRIERHFNKYSKNSKYKSAIFKDYEKLGIENFTWRVLEYCSSTEEMFEKEQYYIEKLNTLHPNGYNRNTGGDKNYKHSEETKKKISEGNLGRRISEETRKKLSDSHKGFKVSDETKKKLSDINKGKKPSKNTVEACIKKLAKRYTAKSPDGEIVEIYNMAKFCRGMGLSNSKMCLVEQGKRKSHKGWTEVNKTQI